MTQKNLIKIKGQSEPASWHHPCKMHCGREGRQQQQGDNRCPNFPPDIPERIVFVAARLPCTGVTLVRSRDAQRGRPSAPAHPHRRNYREKTFL
ncbi:hypothetical protein [Paraburkholderia flava]|uniref:hypothetical protein n=1 Tax=Paraburkholderia flava TaxID=2547393 RepID=UPI00105C5F5C|nr:hypothetical protein [Paraburkholderia flava]